SIHIDPDIGNYSDDYVGTHVELGMMYAYNGDLFDENDSDRIGFHDTLPAVGMMLLKGAKLENDGQDDISHGLGLPLNGFGFEDGIVDNEHLGLVSAINYHDGSAWPYTDPSNLNEAFYHFQGLYSNGNSQNLAGI